MNIKIIMLSVLFSCFMFSSSYANDEKIGSLRKVAGDNDIVRNNETIKAANGLEIYQNDLITTKDGGSLGIIFNDNSRISLGPNSKLKVTKYVYNPSKKKFSMLTKMLKGSAAFTSGKLSKLSPESVKIETPNATIGSRGTTFLVTVE